MKHCMIALSFYAAFLGGSEKTLKASFLFLLSMYVICGSYGGAVVSSFASRQKGPEFESNNIYDTEFTCSTWVLSVYSHFLPQSKNTRRLTSKAKLTALVNGCLHLCVDLTCTQSLTLWQLLEHDGLRCMTSPFWPWYWYWKGIKLWLRTYYVHWFVFHRKFPIKPLHQRFERWSHLQFGAWCGAVINRCQRNFLFDGM